MPFRPHEPARPPVEPARPPVIVVVTGVAGSGKTTIGERLAGELACSFADADWFHSPSNIEKMRAGIPLTDADRRPWLRRLRREVIDRVPASGSAVLACSALKAAHRRLLAHGCDRIRFVYLRVSPAVAAERLRRRTSHFMNPALMASQFDALEEPDDAITVDADQPPDAIVAQVLLALGPDVPPEF